MDEVYIIPYTQFLHDVILRQFRVVFVDRHNEARVYYGYFN